MWIIVNIARLLVYLVSISIISWTISYVLMMGFDFNYYFIYIYYVWIGPGEIPSLITVFAFIIFWIITVICLILYSARSYLHRND